MSAATILAAILGICIGLILSAVRSIRPKKRHPEPTWWDL